MLIGNNNIGKVGARAICEALKINQALQNLNLGKLIEIEIKKNFS